jgi:hypothetical protein
MRMSLEHPSPRRGGPKTPEGKARAALNATRHGLRARHFRLLPHEDPTEFEALALATRAAYRPADAIERELVEAVAVALWRELRADRIEAEALADIAPADGSRSCGSDLAEPAHRASLAVVLRYRAQATAGVRRAQDALARHRRLVAETAARTAEPAPAEPAAPRPPARAADREPACTNELPEPRSGPVRLELREAVRKAANPLDTPLLRALGRDPDLVLPVPGLTPAAWPAAQAHADPTGTPVDGQGPYRRVPHVPWGEWLRFQHLLPELQAAAARAAEPARTERAA